MLDVSSALSTYGTSKVAAVKQLDKNDAALKEKTDAFEAVMVKQMLDIALEEKYSLFPDDPGKDVYKSMYTETMSNSLSGGFGFSELLYNYLRERS